MFDKPVTNNSTLALQMYCGLCTVLTQTRHVWKQITASNTIGYLSAHQSVVFSDTVLAISDPNPPFVVKVLFKGENTHVFDFLFFSSEGLHI